MTTKYSRLLIFFQFSFSLFATAQNKSYNDTILAFQQNYVATHEVLEQSDKKFLRFYSPNENYRIDASFKRIEDKTGFDMNTSSGKKSHYFIYGLLSFIINTTAVQLFIYQSQDLLQVEDYKDYLFVPFGDATSGKETYGGGRYLDFRQSDIRKNKLILDFNKAYNPYCAYVSGYNCPLPPSQNLMKITVDAGEKNYGKPIHSF